MLMLCSSLAVSCSGGGEPTSDATLFVTDTDNDGLTDAQELAGWTVTVDRTGYGAAHAWVYHVTSDPNNPDTDADGLGDLEEFQVHTDPAMEDTDEDSLSDVDEMTRYQTNPLSVDTDGDALEGQQGVPEPRLFDGHEVKVLGTSPTLDDTDGDGRSDLVEEDDTGFHPLIAEIPEIELQTAGDLGLWLDVEYEELVGSAITYGASTTINESTSSSNETETLDTNTYGWEVTVAAEYEFGLFGGTSVSASASASGSHSRGTVTREGSETIEELTQEASRDETNSREMTETAASGRMSVGMRIKNAGLTTFTLTDLAVTALAMQPPQGAPGGSGFEPPSFKTVTTLFPPSQLAEITLSPSETSPVIQLEAQDVNVDIIRSFMRNPSSLAFEDAYYDLRDADNLSFRFFSENTFTRTARIEISTGDGPSRSYRVATNVARDASGNLIGVTMDQALGQILGLQPSYRAPVVSEEGPFEVLEGLDGLLETSPPPVGGYTGPYSRWLVVFDSPEQADDFSNVVLRPGQTVRLTYVSDADGDGILSPVEVALGTPGAAGSPGDSDGDGVTDYDEAFAGWNVQVTGRPARHVFSNPRMTDSDGDGWSDLEEKNVGTDPGIRDTDGDSLWDAADPAPLSPAATVYVDIARPGGGSGNSWNDAFNSLEAANSAALSRNTNGVGADDIAQIWVARGTYVNSTQNGLQVAPGVKIYGGFLGFEGKLGARNPDPLTNQTAISPFNAAGVSTAMRFVGPPPPPFDDPLVDGFAITVFYSVVSRGVEITDSSPTIRNVLFAYLGPQRGQGGFSNGAAIYSMGGTSLPIVEKCVFVGNVVESTFTTGPLPQGGAIYVSGGIVTARDCVFADNMAISGRNSSHTAVGAAASVGSGGLDLTRCVFVGNRTVDWNAGGGVNSARGALTAFGGGSFLNLHQCDMYSNIGAHLEATASVSMTNSRFWQTLSPSPSYTAVEPISTAGQLAATNCTFVLTKPGQSGAAARGVFRKGAGLLFTNNCIFQDVTFLDGSTGSPTGRSSNFLLVNCANTPGDLISSVFNSTTAGFLEEATGNLRLAPTSIAIDAGRNAVDTNPFFAGIQGLPDVDLDGNWRIVNGGGVGPSPIVDLGAYEFQGGGQ